MIIIAPILAALMGKKKPVTSIPIAKVDTPKTAEPRKLTLMEQAVQSALDPNWKPNP